MNGFIQGITLYPNVFHLKRSYHGETEVTCVEEVGCGWVIMLEIIFQDGIVSLALDMNFSSLFI